MYIDMYRYVSICIDMYIDIHHVNHVYPQDYMVLKCLEPLNHTHMIPHEWSHRPWILLKIQRPWQFHLFWAMAWAGVSATPATPATKDGPGVMSVIAKLYLSTDFK